MSNIKKELFFQGLEDYLSSHGLFPDDEEVLCEEMGVNIKEFFVHFESLEACNSRLWLFIIQSTLEVLSVDPEYPGYSIREKLLAFYYTMAEFLERYIHFVRKTVGPKNLSPRPAVLRSFKKEFDEFIVELIDEGRSSGEVANRLLSSKHYTHGFWIQLRFVLSFWSSDRSEEKETADAAIEKAVNVSMDLIAPNALDSILDLGKFIIQNRNIR